MCNGFSSTYNLFINVKSLSLSKAKKVGSFTPRPKFFVSLNEGGRNPLLRSTEDLDVLILEEKILEYYKFLLLHYHNI